MKLPAEDLFLSVSQTGYSDVQYSEPFTSRSVLVRSSLPSPLKTVGHNFVCSAIHRLYAIHTHTHKMLIHLHHNI